MIDREGGEPLGIFKRNEDVREGYGQLALRPVTETEKVSLTVIEKMKSLNFQKGRGTLSITPSDAERVGKRPEKLKNYHDDHAEYSRGGGYWCGVSMQRYGTHCMHKVHRRYK
jgi:hypothetical protein